MNHENEFGKFTSGKSNISDKIGDDPDYGRKEAIKNAGHKTKLLLHRIHKIAIIFILIFLPILFLFILPVSEMTFGDDKAQPFFQRWSIAFLSTSRTAGIALATVIMADLLKKFFDFAKKYANNEDK
ncbi:MAG: hypothetical protein FWE37_02815 [Spirochaetaceae bacterium]|nr:hypothetical protein [Spirochaetaceae bacterium]